MMSARQKAWNLIYLIVSVSTIVAATVEAVAQSQTSTSAKRTLWNHNGSTVYLIANGSLREFYYDQPRVGMLEAGARPGSLLFRGRSLEGRYIGTAYTFDPRCGQRPYEVSGPILDNYERVVLSGQAPRVGSDCRTRGVINDKLEFTLLKSGDAMPSSERPSVSPVDLPLADQASIRMEQQGGVYVVPVRFNDMITLNAIVDSGASDMSIPADIVSTLIRTKTITKEDFLGQQTYVLADGSRVPSQQFRIRSIKVGGKIVEGVVASIASVNGEILLGQSFLNRFKSWSVDNEQHTLTLR
jgi:predicted aspartyl protease